MSSLCQWVLAGGLIAAAGTKLTGWQELLKRAQGEGPQVVKNERIKVDILPFTKHPDPAAVRSAGNYIVLSQVLRSLVRRNIDTQITGDLAVKWTISSDHKIYTFNLDPDAKFSDGSPITAEDVKETMLRTQRMESAVHYDFKKIKSITASGSTLTINLVKSEPDFLMHAVHPEFSPLHRSDYSQNTPPKFAVASGAYFLGAARGTDQHPVLELNRNTYFKGFVDEAPSSVVVETSDNAGKFAKLASADADFIIPTSSVSPQNLTAVDPNMHAIFKPHIGFSYWISINPQRITNRQVRNRIQIALADLSFGPDQLPSYWERAKQLFLPGGPSRLSQPELDQMWSEVGASAKSARPPQSVSLLIAKDFIAKNAVIESLKKAGIEASVTEYGGQAEFAKLVNRSGSTFDLIQANNDFSSVDVIENLNVALNPTRPLILLGDDSDSASIRGLYGKAQHDGPDERQATLGELGANLLRFGLVAPLLHYNLSFYHSKTLVTDAWSKLYPEVAFWKLKKLSQVE